MTERIGVVDISIIKFSFSVGKAENRSEEGKKETSPDSNLETSKATGVKLKKVRNKEFIRAKLDTRYLNEDFTAKGTIVGTFAVSKELAELLTDKEGAHSSDADDAADAILNALSSKFATYVGIMSGDALGVSVIPQLNLERGPEDK